MTFQVQRTAAFDAEQIVEISGPRIVHIPAQDSGGLQCRDPGACIGETGSFPLRWVPALVPEDEKKCAYRRESESEGTRALEPTDSGSLPERDHQGSVEWVGEKSAGRDALVSGTDVHAKLGCREDFADLPPLVLLADGKLGVRGLGPPTSSSTPTWVPRTSSTRHKMLCVLASMDQIGSDLRQWRCAWLVMVVTWYGSVLWFCGSCFTCFPKMDFPDNNSVVFRLTGYTARDVSVFRTAYTGSIVRCVHFFAYWTL